MADLKKGDVVVLKSGSQKMTVISVSEDAYGKPTVTVGWMNGVRRTDVVTGDQTYQQVTVPPEAIERYQ